jgi:hypothetical protein
MRRHLGRSNESTRDADKPLEVVSATPPPIQEKADDEVERQGHEDETDHEPAALQRDTSTRYRGGGIPARKTSRSTSFSSIRPIPPTAPLDANAEEPCASHPRQRTVRTRSIGDTGEERPTVLPVCANHGETPIYHEPASRPPSIHQTARQKLIARLAVIGNALTMPVSLAVIVAIPCALIDPLKALFTPVSGWTGGRMPNAPDGRPPLAWVLETAAFIGAIVVPAGLLLLGAGFARLKVGSVGA